MCSFIVWPLRTEKTEDKPSRRVGSTLRNQRYTPGGHRQPRASGWRPDHRKRADFGRFHAWKANHARVQPETVADRTSWLQPARTGVVSGPRECKSEIPAQGKHWVCGAIELPRASQEEFTRQTAPSLPRTIALHSSCPAHDLYQALERRPLYGTVYFKSNPNIFYQILVSKGQIVREPPLCCVWKTWVGSSIPTYGGQRNKPWPYPF